MTELEKAAELYYCDQSYYALGIEHVFISGAEWAFQNRDIEKVLCAACKYRLRDEDVITLGFRHDQAISAGDACFFTSITHTKN